jgi:hypothetical protein
MLLLCVPVLVWAAVPGLRPDVDVPFVVAVSLVTLAFLAFAIRTTYPTEITVSARGLEIRRFGRPRGFALTDINFVIEPWSNPFTARNWYLPPPFGMKIRGERGQTILDVIPRFSSEDSLRLREKLEEFGVRGSLLDIAEPAAGSDASADHSAPP